MENRRFLARQAVLLELVPAGDGLLEVGGIARDLAAVVAGNGNLWAAWSYGNGEQVADAAAI